MLTEILNAAPGQIGIPPRGTPPAERQRIHEVNSHIYQAIISSHFDGRQSYCYGSTSEFWVYVDTLSEAEDVKTKAKELGYINMHTFEVKYEDEPFLSKYAVSINSRTELLIGNFAGKFFKSIAPILREFKSELIFRYGHIKNFSLTFNSQNTASAFAERLEEVLVAKGEDLRIPATVGVGQNALDSYSVHITFN